ncbi:HAD-IA family hydrolase [Stakelama tenebrarum]|uniref:HAD-IA family hydrolase n=1 Tax=Stakelama tenebrarum TaxID=2711215 RepID=A0A6G6Y8G7_9SPHN|nr:HAD-IA family hydrolase [Sphingosinithalassobacter tenebrarum]QIG81141.1 HAD-IA family hydrolase [Sphingosinithalassobacter tenebrarum]
MNRLALFDCDGTLVDSQANICRAMEECFSIARLVPPDRAAIRRIVGLSLVDAIARLVPDGDTALHQAMAEDYKHAFFTMRQRGTMDEEPLFEGIADTLTALEDTGWLLGVATGKSDRGLHHILEHHGIKQRFATLQTADRHPSKPHPAMVETAMAEAGAAPETTVVIGDTSFDMAMAVAAGAHGVGVAWGYHGPEELIGAGARIVADHALHLPGHLHETWSGSSPAAV